MSRRESVGNTRHLFTNKGKNGLFWQWSDRLFRGKFIVVQRGYSGLIICMTSEKHFQTGAVNGFLWRSVDHKMDGI